MFATKLNIPKNDIIAEYKLGRFPTRSLFIRKISKTEIPKINNPTIALNIWCEFNQII